MKKLLFILLFISLIVPGFLQAAPLVQIDIGVADFYSQTGIQLPGDLKTLEVGQTVFGTVRDADKLSKLGIKDAKVGDKAQLLLLEGNRLKISVMSVKQEKIIQLKK